jgi:hypothetical protein
MNGAINQFGELTLKPFDRLRANGLSQFFLNYFSRRKK